MPFASSWFDLDDAQIIDDALHARALASDRNRLVRFGVALDGAVQRHDAILRVDVNLQDRHRGVGEELAADTTVANLCSMTSSSDGQEPAGSYPASCVPRDTAQVSWC